MTQTSDRDGNDSVQPVEHEVDGCMPESLTVLPDGSTPVPLGSGEICGILGEGGAAIVYEIWNEKLGIKRAVKVLRPNALHAAFERFTTESRITAQLHHPHVIEIHSVGEWNNLPYIEMERLEGQSLDKVIKDCGAFPAPVVVAIGIMICRALKYTHTHEYVVDQKNYQGILHRDLKPANVMIAKNGVVKLMDFGIATPTNASMHTMEGTFVGSLQYLAPEQLNGDRASAGTDLYALGLVMYEMLTGQQAFSERNMTKLISMRLKNEYKQLADCRLNVPKRLLRLINSCLAFERERRARDATAVLEELEAILDQYTRRPAEEVVEAWLHEPAGRQTVSWRRRLPIMRWAGVAAAVAVVGIGGYLVWTRRETLLPVREVREVVRDSVIVTNQSAETVFVAKESPPVPPPEPKLRPKPAPPPVVKTVLPPASASTAPAPSAPPARNEPSFLVKLTQLYGTDDLLAIMAREVSKGNYKSAIEVYDSLTAQQMQSRTALLYKMRALKGLGATSKLGGFFENNSIPDAEFYLAKAQHLYDRGLYSQTLTQLENARAAQAELADERRIRQDAMYYRALSLTALYNQAQSEQKRMAAMEGWYDVKFALRNKQNHRHFKYADEQIRRLSAAEDGR